MVYRIHDSDHEEPLYQIGIVSFGSGSKCGGENKPGFYTKVANFLPWIESKFGSEANEDIQLNLKPNDQTNIQPELELNNHTNIQPEIKLSNQTIVKEDLKSNNQTNIQQDLKSNNQTKIQQNLKSNTQSDIDQKIMDLGEKLDIQSELRMTQNQTEVKTNKSELDWLLGLFGKNETETEMKSDHLDPNEAPLQEIMTHTKFGQANFDKGYTSTNFIGKEIRDSEGKTVYIQFEFVNEEKTSRIFEPLDLNIIRKLIDNRHKSTYDPTLDGLIMRDLTIPDPKENSQNKLSVTPTTMKTSSTTTSTIIKVKLRFENILQNYLNIII